LDGGTGAIAWSFVRSLQACSDSAGPTEKELLATSLVNVLAVALGGTPEARDSGRSAISHGLYRAIRAHVIRHACDPTISVSTVASKFRISPRYLHKLFEQSDDSFAQLVVKERLKHCATNLRALDCGSSISGIAYRAGFGDLSNFCRAFRKHYGMSPRDFRRAARRRPEGND
jgi:AraC-like DNA-binding protein